MTFKKILVALDGSKNSQNAADYGFWLATKLGAELAGQHVVDPRLVDLFVEPEFAEELGFSQSIETSSKVFAALRRIGKVILDLFSKEAAGRGFKTTTFLDEGYVVEEILKYAEEFDLLVMGHRGRAQQKMPATLLLGSVAERVVVGSDVPVLITVQPLDQIKQILVAYDGSEPSRGALLMAENLAKKTDSKLKAVTVIPSEQHRQEAKLIREQGESFLREYWIEEVFSIKEGAVSSTLLDYAGSSNSLLVLGAYGFKDPDRNVLGSTTTKVLRETKTSVLVYKPIASHKNLRNDTFAETTVK